MRKTFTGLAFSAILLLTGSALAAPVTVLAPSQPYILEQPPAEPAKSKKQSAKPADEADVLIALINPPSHTGEDMDMPQFFAALYYPPDFESGKDQPQLHNLLGDVEEIRYLDKKAWGANVSVEKPGLYQFILEGKPWWDAENNRYLHEQAKVALPVREGARGWEAPFGQSFEILPLTRPFGLVAPANFSARLLLDGKPLANIPVRMGRVGNGKIKAASRWAQDMETFSNNYGEVAFTLNEPGWWYCEAAISGDPLKGPDGEMRERLRSTVFWVYVEGSADAKNKK